MGTYTATDLTALLSGGDPRSLGRANDVTAQVLNGSIPVAPLFDCVFVSDETVRMRAGDALEKVCHENPKLLEPFTERLLRDVPRVRQPSVQVHLAQMLAELPLTAQQTERAVQLLTYNLHTIDEWVLTDVMIQVLADFTNRGALPKKQLATLIAPYAESRHKSVAQRVSKLLATL
ncbi:MAG TPA: hypothetical protein VLE73_02860 [Candidatus Saccharimonadales bacterium]|nr:hypothetical protein [Candidatus Saccharimonadales bacterium]